MATNDITVGLGEFSKFLKTNPSQITKMFLDATGMAVSGQDPRGYLSSVISGDMTPDESRQFLKEYENKRFLDEDLQALGYMAQSGTLPPIPSEQPRTYNDLMRAGVPASQVLDIVNNELAPGQYLEYTGTQLQIAEENEVNNRENRAKAAAQSIVNQHPEIQWKFGSDTPIFEIYAGVNDLSTEEVKQAVNTLVISQQDNNTEPFTGVGGGANQIYPAEPFTEIGGSGTSPIEPTDIEKDLSGLTELEKMGMSEKGEKTTGTGKLPEEDYTDIPVSGKEIVTPTQVKPDGTIADVIAPENIGLLGLTPRHQYQTMARMHMGRMLDRPGMEGRMDSNFNPIFGRYILQVLFDTNQEDMFYHHQDKVEKFHQFVNRGFTTSPEEFNNPELMRSGWGNLVVASEDAFLPADSPGAYKFTGNQREQFYRDVAQNFEYQKSAAMAVAGITGMGIFGGLRLKGFNRLINQYNYEMSMEKDPNKYVGLAAWLSRIKGSPWDVADRTARQVTTGTQAVDATKPAVTGSAWVSPDRAVVEGQGNVAEQKTNNASATGAAAKGNNVASNYGGGDQKKNLDKFVAEDIGNETRNLPQPWETNDPMQEIIYGLTNPSFSLNTPVQQPTGSPGMKFIPTVIGHDEYPDWEMALMG